MKLNAPLMIVAATLSLSQLASGAVIGQIDTFQNGTTDGWFAGGLGMGSVPAIPPQVVANGGPQGTGDRYLQVTGIGGNGPGSKIAAINMTQWAGNYLTPGISGIAMDLKNFGSTDLTIRLLFEDPMLGPPLDQAVTTFGAFLPAGGGWTHAFFAIAPGSMTVLSGSVTTLLSNTTLIRIIDSPTPTDAVSIVGVLGIDNINAVPEPSSWAMVIGSLACLAARRRRAS
jgi:hypothetical protein